MNAKWLTPRQVADHLQLHEATVRRLSRRGLIPAMRVGQQLRYDLAAVEAALRGDREAARCQGT